MQKLLVGSIRKAAHGVLAATSRYGWLDGKKTNEERMHYFFQSVCREFHVDPDEDAADYVADRVLERYREIRNSAEQARGYYPGQLLAFFSEVKILLGVDSHRYDSAEVLNTLRKVVQKDAWRRCVETAVRESTQQQRVEPNEQDFVQATGCVAAKPSLKEANHEIFPREQVEKQFLHSIRKIPKNGKGRKKKK